MPAPISPFLIARDIDSHEPPAAGGSESQVAKWLNQAGTIHWPVMFLAASRHIKDLLRSHTTVYSIYLNPSTLSALLKKEKSRRVQASLSKRKDRCQPCPTLTVRVSGSRKTAPLQMLCNAWIARTRPSSMPKFQIPCLKVIPSQVKIKLKNFFKKKPFSGVAGAFARRAGWSASPLLNCTECGGILVK